MPRHFLEATGILNGGERSVFRWNQGQKRKPNVNMFHRSKTQVVFFFPHFPDSPKAVLQKHHRPNGAPFKCVMVMQQKDIYFLGVFAPMLHSCWCILTVWCPQRPWADDDRRQPLKAEQEIDIWKTWQLAKESQEVAVSLSRRVSTLERWKMCFMAMFANAQGPLGAASLPDFTKTLQDEGVNHYVSSRYRIRRTGLRYQAT